MKIASERKRLCVYSASTLLTDYPPSPYFVFFGTRAGVAQRMALKLLTCYHAGPSLLVFSVDVDYTKLPRQALNLVIL